ncbi:MAG TPA: HTTM domain-containing protein [Polyangia bacterium]|nr:HTTM domain-containing protein [Polyangia bacterium]
MVARLKAALATPIDGASLAVFRILFGALMVVAGARFFTHGWIASDYRAAKVFMPYWGLGFIRPWPGDGMYIHYAVWIAAAVCITLGLFYRAATIVFALSFTWAHLCDRANYLNHYYLVSLVALILVFLPLDRQLSLRVRLRPNDRRSQLRTWMLYLLRFQFGLVWLFGGIAKIGGDWIWRAEPLRIWLAADADLPILRHIVRWHALPYLFSWGGLAFDLSAAALLSWPRTRKVAFAVAVVFHALTAELFPIGMFPWIMLAGATLFFAPTWPRRWLGAARDSAVAGAALGSVGLAALTVYALVQLVVPLRHFAYPGNTLWTEEGFRFSWRVMLIEKTGQCEFTVVDAQNRHTLVEPRDYLTYVQARMTCTQPDMILALAHIIADDFARRGRGPVRVFADAQVAWNGRPHAPMIDPQVDLAHEADGLSPKRWILPAPTTAPRF